MGGDGGEGSSGSTSGEVGTNTSGEVSSGEKTADVSKSEVSSAFGEGEAGERSGEEVPDDRNPDTQTETEIKNPEVLSAENGDIEIVTEDEVNKAFDETDKTDETDMTDNNEKKDGEIPEKDIGELPDNVKEAHGKYSDNGWSGPFKDAGEGTKAGGEWSNRDGKLPKTDADGNPVVYKEYDINSKESEKCRDSERFVRGSDGSLYYTNDHYDTFTKIK